MAQLPTLAFAARSAQTPRLAGQPVTAGRLPAVMAIQAEAVLQRLHLRRQPRHLLTQGGQLAHLRTQSSVLGFQLGKAILCRHTYMLHLYYTYTTLATQVHLNSYDALTAYGEAIQQDASQAGAWYYKGVVLKKLKRDEEAQAAYDNAIKLDPSYANTWSTSVFGFGKYVSPDWVEDKYLMPQEVRSKMKEEYNMIDVAPPDEPPIQPKTLDDESE